MGLSGPIILTHSHDAPNPSDVIKQLQLDQVSWDGHSGMMKGTRGGLACKKWENGEFPTQLWLHAATICYCKTETMNQQIWGILWYTLFSNQNQFCFNLSLVFNAGTLRTQLWRSWKNRKKGNSYMAKGGSSLLDFQTQTWPCVDETFWCLFDLRFWGPPKKTRRFMSFMSLKVHVWTV